ncbi:hypothetical protein N7462_010560 [Penicillium macrosclerotiorum]|uniref:uncharacterized protein n=1 Tax=Penicillium macrosclerotiorum TaxID=303699 RepID=UPI00254944E2|nr:uncharacterized protein N7462_010560 [Penicillium macrosclerotiorum]KAJ5669490.1 hypothetical protein N7462_010560 [Penicillium macrosclerotiorum]
MQGFNMGRYVPPDQEGVTSANKLAGKHPLGARARHLHTTGALVVRFEMPFAVWCTTCKPHETLIGQGVRFNAEKKKVGKYYSTPIYSFRMKHTACGGWIEIQTDPKNTAYVVVEGGRKKDTGDDKELQPGEIAIRPPGLGIQDPAEKDPFAKLEGKVEDKRRAQTEASRILELQERQSRDWDDPYEKSKRLRRTFRSERKGLERLAANREALQDKMSLAIDLVDETEEDRQRAAIVDFGEDQSIVGTEAARVTRVRPMFQRLSHSPTIKSRKQDKDEEKRSLRVTRKTGSIAQHRESLRHELTGNTRAAVDPFLNDIGSDQDAWRPGLKRKKASSAGILSRQGVESKSGFTDPAGSVITRSPPSEGLDDHIQKSRPTLGPPPALVGYDSDTE